MKETTFNKKCNATTLTAELRAAGFLCEGVRTEDSTTTVMLKDAEGRSPAAIVTAHVYIAPIQRDFKADYSAALTAADKIDLIAQRIGLK